MKVVIQRSLAASVKVDDQVVGKIDHGFVLFVGVAKDDEQADIDYVARKVANIRLFEDEAGKMNLSLKDVGGSILSISQFTLQAQTKKGNRPSFLNAGDPDRAESLYQAFNQELRQAGYQVETGQFGAYMQVELVNDGPVTIIIDSKAK